MEFYCNTLVHILNCKQRLEYKRCYLKVDWFKKAIFKNADVDDCPTPSPCQNNGICVDRAFTYICENCSTGYTGQNCDEGKT